MVLDRDPEKARAWQERSARKAQERQMARALAAGREPGRQRGQKAPTQNRLKSRSPGKAERYRAIADACGGAIERDGRRCQARLLVPALVCGGPLDPQHVIPQGVDKGLAADERNIVACCRAHHDWIGDHPEEARRLGLHGRWGDDLAELARRRLG